MKARLRLATLGLAAAVYVWFAAVLRAGEVKGLKAERRAARGR
jgi:hypothetical protein